MAKTSTAKIKCPHCGKPITVRQTERDARFEEAFAELEKAGKAVAEAFRKIFK